MTTLILGLAWLACADVPARLPDDDEAARFYFARLYDDRAAIRSGYVEYAVTFHKVDRREDLNGRTHTCRVWFDEDRLRFDLAERRPKEPDWAWDRRLAHAGGIYRLIEDDAPEVAVREYTQRYVDAHKPHPAIRGLTIDPRLFGIVPGHYDTIYKSKLGDVRRYPSQATVRGTRLDVAGEPAARITLDYGAWRQTSFVVKGSSLLPTSITTRILPQARDEASKTDVREVLDEIEVEPEMMPNSQGLRFEFPRRIKFRRTQDGKEVMSQTIEVQKADFNVPVDESTFTWKALNPRVGVSLIPNDDFRGMILWDGEGFQRVDSAEVKSAALSTFPTRPAIYAGSDRPLRFASYVLLGASALIGATVLVVKLVSRNRPSPTHP